MKKEKLQEREPLLRIVPGGRDGDGNWLIKLNEGCVFLTRPLGDGKVKTFELLQFHLVQKWRRACYLQRNFPRVNEDIFVDSLIFSNLFELVEIQDDGTSNLHTGPDVVANDVNDVSKS